MSATEAPTSSRVRQVSGGVTGADSRALVKDHGHTASTTEKLIVTLSDRIRRALECPVCLQLATCLLCNCPNGHAICGTCMAHFKDGDEFARCPVCRSPMENTPDAAAGTRKMNAIVARTRVACAHRQHGCVQLVPVCRVSYHEVECSQRPNVRCLVSTCRWLGVHDQLFDHVKSMHPGVAVDSAVTI